MKYPIVLCVFLGMTQLSGCANTPVKPSTKISDDQVIALKSGGYVKTQSFQLLETDTQKPSDTSLRVITKSHTAGGVAAKTASFVLTALIGGSTSQSTFDKNELKGEVIGAVENPSASYFLPKMNKIIEENIHVNNEADYRSYPLQMSYTNFYLVYSELSGSSLYELTYTMSVAIPRSGKYSLDCSFVSGGYSLDDWSANGYQRVKDTAKSKLDKCLAEFSKESNLVSVASSLENAPKEQANVSNKK